MINIIEMIIDKYIWDDKFNEYNKEMRDRSIQQILKYVVCWFVCWFLCVGGDW